ncbi:MAG: 50S ribosomal protein L30e [Candidatus Thermoplasmatota archaeon]
MDIGRELRVAISTGKVWFGIRQTQKALKNKNAKLVIFASNFEEKYIESIKEKVPTYNFSGTNFELGAICGKPFSISVLTIIEPGESGILALVKNE